MQPILADARNHLQLLSFDETVFLQKAKIMYKIVNNIAPEYLSDLFQMRNANDTGSNLRSVSNKNFVIPKPNNNLFKSSIREQLYGIVQNSETRGCDSRLTSSLRIECNFSLATSDIQIISETIFYS